MDRGAWWAVVPRVAEHRTRLKRLGMHTWVKDIQNYLYHLCNFSAYLSLFQNNKFIIIKVKKITNKGCPRLLDTQCCHPAGAQLTSANIEGTELI